MSNVIEKEIDPNLEKLINNKKKLLRKRLMKLEKRALVKMVFDLQERLEIIAMIEKQRKENENNVTDSTINVSPSSSEEEHITD